MKRIVIVTAAVLCVGGAAYVTRGGVQTGPADAEATAAREQNGLGPRKAVEEFRGGPLGELWPEGVEHEYAFEEKSSTVADGQPFAELSMAGRLFITRLDAELVQYRFEGELRGFLGPGGDLLPLVEDAQKSFFVSTTSDGQVRLHVDPSVSDNVAQIWRSFVAATRLQVPEQNMDAWQTSEDCPLGTCRVRYERTGLNEVRKTRLGCSVPAGAKVVDFQSQRSEQVFTLTGQRIEALTSREALSTEALPGTPSFESQTVLSLEFLHARSRVAEIAERMAVARATPGTLVGLAPGAAPAGRLTREELLARIGSRTFPGVMSKMLDFEQVALSRALTSEENAAFGRSFIALRSMLQLDSKHIADVEKHILANGPLTQHLIGVLGEAGTPEAQAVLGRYLEDSSRSARNRTLAGIALARVDNPTEATLDTLTRMQKDPVVADQATYALGSNVKRLAATGSPLKQRVLDGLLNGLDEAPQDEKERFLVALGNAGDPAALPKLKEYAASAIPSDRKNAANGTRQIPGPEAEALLVQLLGDPEESVRAQAATAIVSRDPTPQLVDALSAVLLSEPSFQVRSKAVNGAALWLRVTPAVAPALRRVALNDEEEDLRLIASRALDKYGY